MKYRLEPADYHHFFRVVALRDIPGVCRVGDEGGLVQSEHSLSQEGNCWIDRPSFVVDGARVEGDAQVINSTIYGNAVVKDMAVVKDSVIKGNSVIGGFAEVVRQTIKGDARIMNVRDVDEIQT